MFNRTPKLTLNRSQEARLECIVKALGVHPDTILEEILEKGLSDWSKRIPRPDPTPIPPAPALGPKPSERYNSHLPIPPGKRVLSV